MSRVPGTYRKPLNVAFVLPSIPDDAPAEVKDALALRNACATEGRCPACGVTPTLELGSDGLGWLTFAHEPHCPSLRDEENA